MITLSAHYYFMYSYSKLIKDFDKKKKKENWKEIFQNFYIYFELFIKKNNQLIVTNKYTNANHSVTCKRIHICINIFYYTVAKLLLLHIDLPFLWPPTGNVSFHTVTMSTRSRNHQPLFHFSQSNQSYPIFIQRIPVFPSILLCVCCFYGIPTSYIFWDAIK